MFGLSDQLAARSEPVRVGVVGAGTFGQQFVGQAAGIDGMRVAGIADLDLDRARDALSVGASEPVEHADSSSAVTAAIEADVPVVTDDATALIESDIDVILEATGVPEAGARHAYEAILAGVDVVMASVEADTVVGPTLARFAEAADVVYAHAYGDQPALTIEMVEWAKTAGFEVIAAGQGREFRKQDRYGTPEDALERFGFTEEYLADTDPNPKLYNSFMDGTKLAVESCAVANAVGLPPDTLGMHAPTAEIEEIPDLFRPSEAGGILEDTGVVDVVSTAYADGSTTETGFPFGIFVVVRAPNERVRRHLHLGIGGGDGVVTSSDGEYALFYRPYHLPGVETAISVANAAIHDQPTGTARDRVAEVVAAAKRNLAPGETIDGGGGETVYGLVERADAAEADSHVPLELLDGAEVLRPVEKDEVISIEDVEVDRDSFLYTLCDLDGGR
jgi:predicted homoserine dehydrogenase-like protein